MSDSFLGEIRLFPYQMGAPLGWAECNGQLLTIRTNTTLFAILGIRFGGDGRTTFGLPDLGGRVAVGQGQRPGGSDYLLGMPGGEPTVTLTTSQMPQHSHDLQVSTSPATERHPAGQGFAVGSGIAFYGIPHNELAFDAQMLSASGDTLPHNNLMPYLTFHFCICLEGEWPPHARQPQADGA